MGSIATTQPLQEPQMITAFFAFVAFGFFAALAAQAIDTVTSTRAYA